MNVYRLRNIKSYFCEKSNRITVIIIFILNDPEKKYIFTYVCNYRVVWKNTSQNVNNYYL